MSILKTLTEGIVERDLQKEGAALLNKWERTGLLEGLEKDSQRQGMARLLENQAKQLLKEASSMAGGDVEGFSAVAFPIVRRVFASLIANDLVSVQPMSLPSGLIFFLDFKYEDPSANESTRVGITDGESLYGGGVVASQITGGVSDITEDGGGFYNLSNHYSSPTGSAGVEIVKVAALDNVTISSATEAQKKLLRFDPDLLEAAGAVIQYTFTAPSDLNREALGSIALTASVDTSCKIVKRLTSVVGNTVTITLHDTDGTLPYTASPLTNFGIEYARIDTFDTGSALGSVVGASTWGLEGAGNTIDSFDGKPRDVIPEIDIKVDSIAVTAITKKLKAKWSPELGQDLNAYHNLDAEVELTSILSEQIALEIDRELLNDLIKGAKAGTYYWSRSPGLFVNRETGLELGATAAAPDFTGTVSEWYETLLETVNDVSAQIHRKTLRGGANFLVTSPEVANIMEFTSGFRASVTADVDRGTAGAFKTGTISKKFDVYVDPYFPRNLILVGRKGNNFLESGYVYAPYVPLQVTPTIFGVEDFVPRKGVMTRYAKKMVRPDYYGLVVVRGLLGESGS